MVEAVGLKHFKTVVHDLLVHLLLIEIYYFGVECNNDPVLCDLMTIPVQVNEGV